MIDTQRHAVLHVCSAFAQQQIYPQLVSHLSDKGVRQKVFAPVRTSAEAGRQPEDLPGMVEYRIKHILRPAHRIFFRTKIRTVDAALRSSFDLAQVGLTHAHFLYSDGAVALRLKQTLGLPFVTAVRNTDVNFFMRYRPDLRRLANRILAESAKVVFLSPAYRNELLGRLGHRLRDQVEAKSVVIPNGIASWWLSDTPRRSEYLNRPLRLLYVGDFSANKNIMNTLRAVDRLAAARAVRLTLVGGGGDADDDIRNVLESGVYPFARFVGRIDDRQKLRAVYSGHDIFVMPSFTETFGVVYLEALSQGLPIVHSRGQGIDGFFDNGSVSEAVDPHDPDSIAAGVTALAERIEEIRVACIDGAKGFRWETIAGRYMDLYRGIPS